MRVASISIAIWLLAAGANAAIIHVDTDSELYSAAPGTIATVTVTLTTLAETVVPFSNFFVRVGWDPTVVKVAGSNPPTTFGKATQSPILPGLIGSLNLNCVAAGAEKGKACTLITQPNNTSVPVPMPAGLVVIGTLLLEVLPGALPGSSLGLSITSYANITFLNPALDPNLTITSNFQKARLAPEPSTAALLAIGLVALGLARRYRTRIA